MALGAHGRGLGWEREPRQDGIGAHRDVQRRRVRRTPAALALATEAAVPPSSSVARERAQLVQLDRELPSTGAAALPPITKALCASAGGRFVCQRTQVPRRAARSYENGRWRLRMAEAPAAHRLWPWKRVACVCRIWVPPAPPWMPIPSLGGRSCAGSARRPSWDSPFHASENRLLAGGFLAWASPRRRAITFELTPCLPLVSRSTRMVAPSGSRR
jgi:hypothetical protein